MYNIIINKLIQIGKIQTAESIFKKSVMCGNSPSIHVITMFVQGYLEVNNETAAYEKLDQYLASGSRLSNVTLHKLYLYLKRTGFSDRAIQFFNTLVQLGIRPHIATINSHIHLLSSLGLDQQVSTTLNALELDFAPDTCTFNTLMSCTFKRGLTDRTSVFF